MNTIEKHGERKNSMIKTKYGFLVVTCEGCNADEFMMFLENYDKANCDTCGQVRRKVTFKGR